MIPANEKLLIAIALLTLVVLCLFDLKYPHLPPAVN